MTASNSRKRLHSPDKDLDECLPISKRIHRLQIEPEGRSSTEEEYKHLMRSDSCNDQSSSEDAPLSTWPTLAQDHVIGGGDLFSCTGIPLHTAENIHQPAPTNNSIFPSQQTLNNHVLIHDESAGQGRLLTVNDEDMERYSPELMEEDNPHYFQINKILFQANSSRLQRSRSSCRLLHNEQNQMS